MKSLKAVLPLVVLGILTLTPFYAQAASAHFFGPIIDGQCICKDSAPDWGCVLDTAHNVFNLIFSLSVLVFVITAALAGLTFMSASVNPEGKKKAKAMLLNTVVGLLIALSAWLIVDFVMRLLYNDSAGFGPWNSILKDGDPRRCLVFAPAPSIAVNVTSTGIQATQEGNSDTATGSQTQTECNPGIACVSLREEGSGVPCTNSQNNTCLTVPSLATKLKDFNEDFDPSWTVTEAFDNAGHTNPCHAAGTCVDVDFLNNVSPNASQIAALVNTMRSNGLYACWEVTSTSRREALISSGLPAAYVDTSGNADGEHASVYMLAPSGGTCNRGND